MSIYDYMRKKFKDLQLCYMDTNSLVYHIGTDDFYAEISKDVPTRLIHQLTDLTGHYLLD